MANEWEVPCTWCGAKAGEPCRKENGIQYYKTIHRTRAIDYDKKHGLHPSTRPEMRGFKERKK